MEFGANLGNWGESEGGIWGELGRIGGKLG